MAQHLMVITQGGKETLVTDEQEKKIDVPEKKARDWLAAKLASHKANGWTILREDANSFEAEKPYADGSGQVRRRRLSVRELVV